MKKSLSILSILCLLFTNPVTFADETPHGEKFFPKLVKMVGSGNATVGLLTAAFATLATGSGASCLKNILRVKKATKTSSKLYRASIAAITGSLAVCSALPAGLCAYVLIFK